MNIAVIGKFIDAFKYVQYYDIFVAICNNFNMERIQENLEKLGTSILVFVHPKSFIS